METMSDEKFANWGRSFKEATAIVLRDEKDYDGSHYATMKLAGLPFKHGRRGAPNPYPWVHSYIDLGVK